MSHQKIWGVTYPMGDTIYAWLEKVDRGPRINPASPLKVQWLLGSDIVGDFTHLLAFQTMFVKNSVGESLISNFPELGLGKVELFRAQNLIRQDNVSKRMKPLVWWPYTGEELKELRCLETLIIDMFKTTAPEGEVEGESAVYICGCAAIETFPGSEKTLLVERKPNEGLFVRRTKPLDFFRLESPSGCELMCCSDAELMIGQWFGMYCSTRGKKFIEDNNFTNVGFLEVGEFFE
jgi:hypothetical protein